MQVRLQSRTCVKTSNIMNALNEVTHQFYSITSSLEMGSTVRVPEGCRTCDCITQKRSHKQMSL